MSTSIAVVDSTVQLKWEMSKEVFDNCDLEQSVTSPLFNVKNNEQESTWSIRVYPKGKDEMSRNKVKIFLLNRGQVTQVAKYKFAIETPDGYWPADYVMKMYSFQDERKEKIFPPNNYWGYSLGSTECVSSKIYNNKLTIVATLVIYGKGQRYLAHNKAAMDYVRNSRSISDLDGLSNVTLVCQGKRFKCHKAILASMSSFFKTKFTNGNFSDRSAEVVKIDDSTSEVVEKMVSFLSSGLIPEDIDETARELIKLSTFYGIDSLTSVCEKTLIKNLSSENVIETFIFFDKYLPTSENRQNILDFMKTNRNEVVASPDWVMFCTNHPNLVAESYKSL